MKHRSRGEVHYSRKKMNEAWRETGAWGRREVHRDVEEGRDALQTGGREVHSREGRKDRNSNGSDTVARGR